MSGWVRRRDFLGNAMAAGGMFAARRLFGAAAPDSTPVKRVIAVFGCHFDAGFVNTQKRVLERYFQEFFPAAIRIAGASRRAGADRYIWTTGSWLLYQYLEQAAPAERAAAEKAIEVGDLTWHALPFNWQSELLDESQITGSLSIAGSLNARFGKTSTGAKLTDVPGHTRGLIAPLAAWGVTLLDIGVNGASRPADVPPIFRWQDSRGNQLTVMYHHNYGSLVHVPGSDLAVAIVVRNDNSGPHTPQEITQIFSDLRRQFTDAQVQAGSLDDVARAVLPYTDNLAVITQEIGDTWIYGAPSDPIKIARYREVSRLRREWISRGAFRCGDEVDRSFLVDLLLEPEHTWGTDTKTWLDFNHYTPDQLKLMLTDAKYKVVAYSWKEKRDDLFSSLQKLPGSLRREAEEAIAALSPVAPAVVSTLQRTSEEVVGRHFRLRLDRNTGAIHKLEGKLSGVHWATPAQPLALISYQTLSASDYERFFQAYIISSADWARKDFGKPEIDRQGAVSRTWHPTVDQITSSSSPGEQKIIIVSSVKDQASMASGVASFPQRFVTEILLHELEPDVSISVAWFGKRPTRLPESLWLTFQPAVAANANWSMEKCSEPISPLDVVNNGGRSMHAVSSGVSCQIGKATLFVDTIDAPVVAFGERSPLNFSEHLPDLATGVHCNLFNNAWGTNYVQWFGEDCRLRFKLRERTEV